jgi:KipI family sensor histidine kinase inhibitor
MSVRVVAAGECALVVEFDEVIDPAVNAKVLALEYALRGERQTGIVETVPSFRSLLVYYDPFVIDFAALEAHVRTRIGALASVPLPTARQVELPCCYQDAQCGFELDAAAGRLGISPAELVHAHSQSEYRVYFLGFAPGQPYMTGMPERLTIPRLASPRTKTPAGAVGIGGTQCCVYSVESPGGFWVLGQTPVPIYDPRLPEPILLRPGDRVRFRPIDRGEFERIAAEVHAHRYRPVIR